MAEFFLTAVCGKNKPVSNRGYTNRREGAKTVIAAENYCESAGKITTRRVAPSPSLVVRTPA